jgi:LysM repeat protein
MAMQRTTVSTKGTTPTAASWSPQMASAIGVLQRQCACGNHTVAGGECTECAKSKSGLQRKVAIGVSHDQLEREPDQVAANRTAFSSVSASESKRLQRQDALKEKTNEEKYKEGLEKLGEAFLETPFGKEILEKIKQDTLVKGATELSKQIISTWSGKIVTGVAATGAVAALAAIHKELPVQIPEIPLNVLTPGLSVQLTYKGPVDKPTEAMFTFKFTEQASKNSTDKKPISETDKFRAETARLAAADAKFRAGMTYRPGSLEDLQQKAEQEAVRKAVLKYSGGLDIDATTKKYPWLATPQPTSGLQLTIPKLSFGAQPPSLLGDEFKLKTPLEQKKKQDEPPLQRKLGIGTSHDPLEQEADRVGDRVLAEPTSSRASGAAPRIQRYTGQATGDAGTAPASVHRVLASAGRPLEPRLRQDMEQRFSYDFSRVRVHTGGDAEQSAQEVNAQAYTVGSNIVFGQGKFAPGTQAGQHLMAHELTHVVQQDGVGKRVQRYEAGEHAQLGETQAELQPAVAPISYTVKKGDQLSAIAFKFGITVAELKDANKDKLKKWPAKDGSGRMIEGFNAGEIISIPQKVNDFAKAATKDKSATFTVNGVVLDYGVGIAMADLFESPEQMAKVSPEELKELAALIKREQTGGKPVTTEEWQKATRGRYLKLAEKNVTHFAPPNAGFVTPSARGAASPNHKSEWEKHHKAALEAAVSGDKDKALMINAFGDHFLTDAFAAGHLINKLDVMEQFKSQLKLDVKGGEFTKESKQFFDDVAKDAFTGGVKTEFSMYETVEFKGVVFRPNIDSESRFSQLLQGIHKEEPDLLANAVAKGVHDQLNTLPGGLSVENAMGNSWQLSGDGTLNTKTMEIARKAVAQSQLNVMSYYKNFNLVSSDHPALYKKVWDYTPRPSPAGIKQLVDVVKKGTAVNSDDLKKAVVKLIRDNYKLIIEELVKRKKLKKA